MAKRAKLSKELIEDVARKTEREIERVGWPVFNAAVRKVRLRQKTAARISALNDEIQKLQRDL